MSYLSSNLQDHCSMGNRNIDFRPGKYVAQTFTKNDWGLMARIFNIDYKRLIASKRRDVQGVPVIACHMEKCIFGKKLIKCEIKFYFTFIYI